MNEWRNKRQGAQPLCDSPTKKVYPIQFSAGKRNRKCSDAPPNLSLPLPCECQGKTTDMVPVEIVGWEIDLPWESNSWTLHIYQAVWWRA